MRFYAQPYAINATGFYFETAEEFAEKLAACRDDEGMPVEEFEIQFIDGTDAEAVMVAALEINQANLARVIDFVEEHGDDARITASVVYRAKQRGDRAEEIMQADYLGEEIVGKAPDAHSEEKAIEEYAYQYVDDAGLLDGVNETVARYFDYQAFARDLRLGGDVMAIEVCGAWYVIDGYF